MMDLYRTAYEYGQTANLQRYFKTDLKNRIIWYTWTVRPQQQFDQPVSYDC